MSDELAQRQNSGDPEHTISEAGTFISEDAVRGALKRGAQSRRSGRAATPAGGRTKLRRWSVADLIARAVPRPPAGGVAN